MGYINKKILRNIVEKIHHNNSSNNSDIFFMQQALQQAKKAAKIGEVPVGAIITKNKKIIATGFNRCIIDNDSTAHAEIVAIRTAESILQNYRLTDCEMFITLEPCLMCAGAIFNARISRIVYACQDFKSGVHKSLPNFDVFFDNRLNIGNKTKIVGGICQNQSLELLQNFFKNKRSKEKI